MLNNRFFTLKKPELAYVYYPLIPQHFDLTLFISS